MSPPSQAEKAAAFRALHAEPGAFLMPNAWDAGSAKILAEAGFEALGTTSVGIAALFGRPDYQWAVSRKEMLEACAGIAAAVPLPISGDLEAGYGDGPEACAETIRLSAEAGLVAGSIEDHTSDSDKPLYDLSLAVERVRAAVEAAEATGMDYTLTARAECYLVGHEDPMAESIRRLNAYHEAGAHCLYAPGQSTAEQIGTLVREVAGPVNVVMGLAGSSLTVAELQDLGVRRISIGGSLARACLGLIRRAAEEMASQGSFSFAEGQIANGELIKLFKDS